MVAFIVRRLIQTVFVLLSVSLITFSLLQIMPGDPATMMLGPEASPAKVAVLRQELNLDQPVYMQYLYWLGNFTQGNLGKSVFYHESVASLIATRIPTTFHVGVRRLHPARRHLSAGRA